MAKKMFLNRERATPIAPVPSISREEPDAEVAFSNRNNPVLGIRDQLPFMILDETSKTFLKFNATGSNLLIKFRTQGEEQNPTTYLRECITA